MEQVPAENQYIEDSDPEKFIAKMGAECLIELLSRIDLEDFLMNCVTKQITKPLNNVKQKP